MNLEKKLCLSIDSILGMKGLSILSKDFTDIELEEEEYYISPEVSDLYLLLRVASEMLDNGTMKIVIDKTAKERDVRFLKDIVK